MAISALLVKSYTTNVYLTGGTTLASIELARPDYVAPVMQRAADTYYIEDIDYSLERGWISVQEYEDTLALKGPEDPQNRPIEAMSVLENPIE